MAPGNISPGSAATVLSFLALAGLQLSAKCYWNAAHKATIK